MAAARVHGPGVELELVGGCLTGSQAEGVGDEVEALGRKGKEAPGDNHTNSAVRHNWGMPSWSCVLRFDDVGNRGEISLKLVCPARRRSNLDAVSRRVTHLEIRLACSTRLSFDVLLLCKLNQRQADLGA